MMFSRTLPRQTLSRGLASTRSITPARPWSCGGHQRRKSSSSSSKPSNPSRGPGVCTQQQQRETPSERSRTSNPDGPSRRLSTRLSRRKANKEGGSVDAAGKSQDEAFSKLPSVPNTNHLHPADIAVSAFFSLHRPISITNSIPNSAANGNAFEDIFRPGSTTRHVQSSDVINTLSSAVRSLEGGGGRNSNRSYDNATDHEFRAALTSVSDTPDGQIRHLDGDPNATTALDIKQLIARRFIPFRPPPVPSSNSEPGSESNPTSLDSNQQHWSNSSTQQSGIETDTKAQQRMFSTVLTIVESTHANGSKSYTARTSPMVSRQVSRRGGGSGVSSGHHHHRLNNTSSSSSATTYLERKRLRHNRWMTMMEHSEHAQMRSSSSEGSDMLRHQHQGGMTNGLHESEMVMEEHEDTEGRDGEEERGMYTISVRRQRKLKMKKHKYKKLMRRTRNLRRRLDRT